MSCPKCILGERLPSLYALHQDVLGPPPYRVGAMARVAGVYNPTTAIETITWQCPKCKHIEFEEHQVPPRELVVPGVVAGGYPQPVAPAPPPQQPLAPPPFVGLTHAELAEGIIWPPQ